MCPDTICHHTAGLIKEIGSSSPELVKRIVVAPNCCPIAPKILFIQQKFIFLYFKKLN